MSRISNRRAQRHFGMESLEDRRMFCGFPLVELAAASELSATAPQTEVLVKAETDGPIRIDAPSMDADSAHTPAEKYIKWAKNSPHKVDAASPDIGKDTERGTDGTSTSAQSGALTATTERLTKRNSRPHEVDPSSGDPQSTPPLQVDASSTDAAFAHTPADKYIKWAKNSPHKLDPASPETGTSMTDPTALTMPAEKLVKGEASTRPHKLDPASPETATGTSMTDPSALTMPSEKLARDHAGRKPIPGDRPSDPIRPITGVNSHLEVATDGVANPANVDAVMAKGDDFALNHGT